MAKSNRLIIIALECDKCKKQNYTEYKRKNIREKREKKKYCPNCKEHTKHIETKVK